MARQLGEVQKLAAQETATSHSLRLQLAKARASGPAAVNMTQVHSACSAATELMAS